MPNPVCETKGCGPWTPPLVNNPLYQGKWVAPKIPNPLYKGVYEFYAYLLQRASFCTILISVGCISWGIVALLCMAYTPDRAVWACEFLLWFPMLNYLYAHLCCNIQCVFLSAWSEVTYIFLSHHYFSVFFFRSVGATQDQERGFLPRPEPLQLPGSRQRPRCGGTCSCSKLLCTVLNLQLFRLFRI